MNMNYYNKRNNNPQLVRAGLKWTEQEDKELMYRLTTGMKIEEIASSHKRSLTGVKCRIMLNGLKMMNLKNMTIEEVSKFIMIPVEELKKFKEEKEQKSKINKNDDKSNVSNKNTEILTEIRDLLKVIIYLQCKSNPNALK